MGHDRTFKRGAGTPPERPAFVEVPTPDGKAITAVVATRNGLAPVELNGVEHVGLLLSVNAASATIAVMTAGEAQTLAIQLQAAAEGVNIANAKKGQGNG